MLREHDRAPDFILPDKATGGQLALADLIGSYRIAILLVPAADEGPEAQAFLDAAAGQTPELAKRDLLVIAIVAPEVRITIPQPAERIHVLADASGEASKQYDGANECLCLYLIGKNGTVESARTDLPWIDEVFRILDATEIRREPVGSGAA